MKETGDMKLEWGNYETCLKLMKMIAYKEGFRDIPARGSKEASETIGKGSEKGNLGTSRRANSDRVLLGCLIHQNR